MLYFSIVVLMSFLHFLEIGVIELDFLRLRSNKVARMHQEGDAILLTRPFGDELRGHHVGQPAARNHHHRGNRDDHRLFLHQPIVLSLTQPLNFSHQK